MTCIIDKHDLEMPSAFPAFQSPPVNLPALPLSAQISLENAARLRYEQRTGKVVQLLDGGETKLLRLAHLCRHCGQAQGTPAIVPYQPEPVDLCDDCFNRAQDYARMWVFTAGVVTLQPASLTSACIAAAV